MKQLLSLIGFVLLTAYHGYAARPTVHTSNITTNGLQCKEVRLNWVNGDGAARLIIAKEGALPSYTPQDGQQYTADPTFGFSAEYGTGNYIVYNANGTNFVTIYGLQPGKTYYFAVYEHDNNGTGTEYFTTGAPSVSVTTYDIRLDFTSRVIDSCQMTNSFEFTNTSISSIPGISYKFDFGNGTSTSSPVTHKFNGSGFVPVTLYPVTNITGCPSLLTKTVKIFPKKLGTIDKTTFKDTQCLENNYFEVTSKPPVQPFPMGVTYRWWFGDGDSLNFPKMKKSYKTSGTFNVMLELTAMSFAKITACKDTLFFPVTVLPSPVGNITINDTFQCLQHNGFVFNNPDNSLKDYKWYFGDNDSSNLKSVSHVYKDTGTYKVMHVAFALSGCKGRDTIEIRVLPDLNSAFSLPDTFFCKSALPQTLQPAVSGGTWYGYPVSGNTFSPDILGTHRLTYVLKDRYCSDTTTDSFRVAPVPAPYIGRDTAVCSALNFVLNANETGTSYSWNTGENTQSITVSSSGIYTVRVDLDKCNASDTIQVTFATAPKLDIGSDTILCKGGSLRLNASSPGAAYLWNNGSTDSAIYAFSSGKYKVRVSNACGIAEDSIYVNFQGDYCDLFMANAFSPGNDLLNNEFVPRGRNIQVQLFQIYNRWGELLFETTENNKGWDGTYGGEVVQDGLYIWKLFYTTANGPYIKKSNASGQVILIR